MGDQRLAFMENYILMTLRMKLEKWTKMITTEIFKDTIMGFLNEPYQQRLIFSLNAAGLPAPAYEFPSKPRSKIVFFIRKTLPTRLTADNMKTDLFYGDLLPNVLENLVVLFDDVIFPLLNNPANQVGWTSVMVNDMKSESQDLRNCIAQMKGQMINRTILPLPICIDEVMEMVPKMVQGDFSKFTSLMKHSIEGMIVKWMDSIDDFINIYASEYIFKKDEHPRPEHLINFWEARLENLENLVDQLGDIRIKTITYILEKISSIFETSLRSLVEKIMKALVEARDIKLHLSPLKKIVDRFETNDLSECAKDLRPLVLHVGLVWGLSKYFHTVDNMSLLFTLIHNTLIDCASRTIEPDGIFQGDVDEAYNRTDMVISFLESYRNYYHKERADLLKYKQHTDFNSQEWTWQLDTIFWRYDRFIERLHKLKEIFKVGISFGKLEKVTIGGLKGRSLTHAVERILDDYNTVYRDWSNISFNVLETDPNILDFDKEKAKFDAKVEVLERKLAFLFEKSYEDSRNLRIVGSLINRPIIKEQLESKFLYFIEDFSNEINDAAADFEKFAKNQPNMSDDVFFPKVCGSISWLTKLENRLTSMNADFAFYEVDFFHNDFGIDTLERYNKLLKAIAELRRDIINQWDARITTVIQEKMNEAVLRKEISKKNGKPKLIVNFDIELQATLKNTRTLLLLGCTVSEPILDFYNRENKLWEARIKLMRIAEWYNDIHEKANSFELKLLYAEMSQIDESLNPLLTTELWGQFNIEYITGLFSTIEKIHLRLMYTQKNIEAIKRSIQSWGKIPLYLRKDKNPKNLLDIKDRAGIFERRTHLANATQKLIEQLLMVNLKLFLDLPVDKSELPVVPEDGTIKRVASITAEPTAISEEDPELVQKESPASSDTQVTAHQRRELLKKYPPEKVAEFHQYEKYVDEQIAEQLIDAVYTSLNYLRMEFENRFEYNSPIFEIEMELQEPNIVFFPNIETTQKHGFTFLVESITDDIFRQLTLLKRVSPNVIVPGEDLKGENFMDDIKDKLEIHKLKNDIMQKVKFGISAIRTHIKIFTDFSFIWTESRQNYLKEIKTYGRPLKPAERNPEEGEIKVPPLKDPNAPLSVYKEQLDKFIALKEEVKKWDNFLDINVWLRLNKQSFKNGVLNEIGKWIAIFKTDLINRVADSLQELQDFIAEAKTTLALEIDKEDLNGLLQIMSILSTINEKQNAYDEMFEPLKDIVELLKQYNYEFPAKVLNQLADLPDMWNKTKRDVVSVKQNIGPMQAYQVNLIEKRILLFNNMTSLYRKRFLEGELFLVSCKEPYGIIDRISLELNEIEKRQEHLSSSAVLFVLQPPDATHIKRTRNDLALLKQMWDYFISVESTIADWQTTPWKKIDIESMDMECKKIGKELRGLGKEMRNWAPYSHMESSLKNLMTSLRAITELQNPAIRDRHWTELMATTKVKFSMNEGTTLKELIDLNLHKFEEEVKNIVDKSVKEMAMEKVLKDISTTWSDMEFATDLHDRTGLKLLKASEEMIETLEDNQVQLQNMLSSKFVGYFQKQVQEWQNKLSNADAVISSWFEVQRKWQYLESIFIGSEDIRNQLPEDSKRFDAIDKEFKTLLNQMGNDRNIVRSTNRGGGKIYDTLERLLNQLLLCEKALNDYLETKRLAYPRFYFVSSADLLDILSNGNNPKMVSRHLTKLYDSLGSLSLIEGTKLSKGMVAKELEEFVPFLQKCDCSGKVETWLNRVTDEMRNTLRHQFRQAVLAYEKKPRHVWIFEWPAQPALVTTQIWWTTETDDAFVKLGMRYENALKDYNRKQVNQLNNLIVLLLGDLTAAERQKNYDRLHH